MARQFEMYIEAFKDVSTGKSNWKKYEITSQTGETEEVLFPPDVTYVPEKGHKIHVREIKNGALSIDKFKLPGAKAANNGQVKSGGSGSNAFDEYTVNLRDPKIELQNWGKEIFNVYLTCLPDLENKPSNFEEIDDFIDQGFAKVLEIQQRIEERLKAKAETE